MPRDRYELLCDLARRHGWQVALHRDAGGAGGVLAISDGAVLLAACRVDRLDAEALDRAAGVCLQRLGQASRL